MARFLCFLCTYGKNFYRFLVKKLIYAQNIYTFRFEKFIDYCIMILYIDIN